LNTEEEINCPLAIADLLRREVDSAMFVKLGLTYGKALRPDTTMSTTRNEDKRSHTAKQAFYGRYGLIFPRDETFIPSEVHVSVLFSDHHDFVAK